MLGAVTNFLKGGVIGITNVVPGISGATMAIILGIFDPIIEAASGFSKDIKRHSVFLIPIVLGAGVGIIAFSSVIEYALDNYSFPTCMFFMGLVIGSIPLIYRKATEQPYKRGYMLATLIAALVVIGLSLTRSRGDMDARTVVDASLMLKMYFGGMLGAMVMVIPGISAAFVLVLLGLYPIVIKYVSAIKDYLLSPTDFALFFEIFLVLAPFSIGMIVGIMIISKIINALLKRAYSITYFTILGLVFGSVFGLFNDPITYQSGVTGLDIAIGAAALVIGAILAIKLGSKK